MKTKVNFDHRLMMGLLVMGSIVSMLVSSAFTTAPTLGTQNSVTLTAGGIQISAKSKEHDNHKSARNEDKEDTTSNNSVNTVTELSGTLGNLVVTPTRASFTVGGAGARMDADLINGFSFSNGDQVTVEGYYLGSNGSGTFLVTEIDRVP